VAIPHAPKLCLDSPDLVRFDRQTAEALTEAGYMPEERFQALFGRGGEFVWVEAGRAPKEGRA